MKKVKVSLYKHSYPVFIGESSFLSLDTKLDKLSKNLFLVVDKNVEKFHGKTLNKVFSEFDKVEKHIIKHGEKSKSQNELNKIYSDLLENNFSRDTTLISIGGGVTGDVAGMAASTFMRGINLVHIPTTLLSSVDSSIGGKTGINFEDVKNVIGTFYQPKLVLIDPLFLRTLPPKEYQSGLGEIIKYGLLSNYHFFFYVNNNLHDIMNRNSKVLEDVIYKTASLKASIVAQDEKDNNVRQILNLGHTFGHAIETNSNFKVTHGDAVMAGIIAALLMSYKKGFLLKSRLDMFLKLLNRIKLPKIIQNLDNEKMYKVMSQDKKNKGGKIKFVLLADIGNVLIDIEANKKEIFYSLDNMKELIS
ncbi:MAG: 3-dehydroquinate synthase [Syntrophothermus sp.]|nr:3-dehydroquinate synthase [Ignavibacteriaceae bacterium]